MANYTVVTNFAAKDGLASGNPAKLVLGVQFTTEFNNIAAAIATKFDGSVVFAPDGTAAQPSYGFTNNAGTGMFNTAGVLGFATANTNRVTIGPGVQIGAPTGGDKGAGTINATGLFINNVAVSAGAGVTSITGTANQIAASASTGAITLSLPQNVIVPTPASGVALVVAGVPGDAIQISTNHATGNGLAFTDTNGAPQSFRMGLGIGDASASLVIYDATNAAIRLKVAADGGLIGGAATGGSKGAGTVNATGLYVNGTSVSTGATLVAVKAALTARASTTTLSNDPDLVLAIPGAGTYSIEALVSVYNTAGATIGASYNLNYSGTFTAASSIMGVATGTTGPSGNAVITATATTSLVAGNCGVTSPSPLLVKATLVATGAGNLGFAWAQNNTNATATNVGAGSYITATKIA